jgi:SAM-dependent methyltransferase
VNRLSHITALILDYTGEWKGIKAMTDYYAGYAEFYDLQMESIGGRDDIDYYAGLAASSPGPILEIGCGTGRVTIPMATSGARVTGMDLCPDMLAVAQSKVAALPESVGNRIELVRGDMTGFDLGRTFPLIVTPFRPFQHLATPKEQKACLDSVRKHLAPGGTFVLDIFDPDLDILTDRGRAEEFGDEEPIDLPDRRRLTVRYRTPRVDRANQICHCEMIYLVEHPDGGRERLVQEFIMRWTYRYEAEYLLKLAGFTVKNVFGGYRGEPVGSGELVFIAEPGPKY